MSTDGLEPVPGSRLRRYARSYGVVRLGHCGALMAADVWCDRPVGHLAGDLPHRAHDPSGSGASIEFDDEGHRLPVESSP